MAIYWPTPGFKGRTFKLCVLTRWDFNFCVRSFPLRGLDKTSVRRTHIKLERGPDFQGTAMGLLLSALSIGAPKAQVFNINQKLNFSGKCTGWCRERDILALPQVPSIATDPFSPFDGERSMFPREYPPTKLSFQSLCVREDRTIKTCSTFWRSLAIRSVVTGNHSSGPFKSLSLSPPATDLISRLSQKADRSPQIFISDSGGENQYLLYSFASEADYLFCHVHLYLCLSRFVSTEA